MTGVAQVQVFGAAKYAVRIDLDPRKLSAYGIGIDEAAGAIQTANVNLPTGTIYGPEHTYTVLANGQLLRAPAYASTIVAYRNGNPVRLDAVAHVYDGVENDKSASWYQGQRAVYLAIQKQPGTNVVAVVDAIKAAAADLPRAAAAVGGARSSAAIAPSRSASRWPTSSSRCCSRSASSWWSSSCS